MPGFASTLLSPPQRVSAYYLTMFMSGGVATVYGGIWFSQQGLSPGQIGLVNSAPTLVLLMINLFVGRIADRAQDWRQVIVLLAFASALMPFGLFFSTGFWSILIFWSLTVITHWSMTNVLDAAASRYSLHSGTSFATFRAWGTVGFTAILFATGILTAQFGSWVFLPLFTALGVLRAFVALGLPNFRAPGPTPDRGPVATRLGQILRPWFVLPLLGWSMVFSTHLVLNAFQSLLWKQQGMQDDLIGILIAVGALSEVAMFFLYPRLRLNISARHIMLISAAVAILRWLAMAASPPVALLFPLQMLHSVSYAIGFLACMKFITNWTSDSIAAEAQGFFVMLQQATAIIAVTAFGWLAGQFGSGAYLASAAICLAGGLLITLSLRMQQPHS